MPSPIFSYLNSSGPIPAAALRELFEKLPERPAGRSTIPDRLIHCRALEVIESVGSSSGTLRIAGVEAMLQGRRVFVAEQAISLKPNQTIYFAIDPEPRPLLESHPAVIYFDPRPRLSTTPIVGGIALAKTVASGKLDPWYWPEVKRIGDHPLSLAAGRRLAAAIGDAPGSLRMMLSHADEFAWPLVLSVILGWLESSNHMPDGLKNLSAQAPVYEWAGELVAALTGDRASLQRFERVMRFPCGAEQFDLVGEIAPFSKQEWLNTPGGLDGSQSVQQTSYAVPRNAPKPGPARPYLALIIAPQPSDSKMATVTIRQGTTVGTKEITPKSEPILIGEIAGNSELNVEVRGGCAVAAALYCSNG